MGAYYNEIDPYAAAWLRNLIAAGYLPDGEVDTRSLLDVRPEDVRGFTQCHFFAGIGGWALALRLAQWPDTRAVWTGSCPCQPFSVAGRGDGMRDERHLWPYWFALLEQCRPAVVFGEQVEAAARHGWIDLVRDDMEGIGYAVGMVGAPAAGVGAPHIRQRLWFVADTDFDRSQGRLRGRPDARRETLDRSPGCDGAPSGVADDEIGGRRKERANAGWLVAGDRAQGLAAGLGASGGDLRPGPTNGLWRDADWLFCRDGKWRPVEPGTFPLAHGVPNRVGRLRAYGNAIVPQVAAEVIRAYMDIRGCA